MLEKGVKRNELLEEIKQEVLIHKNLHLNDPAIYKCWAVYENILSQDLSLTKWLLENVGEDFLYWISESFEEISLRLQSKDFVDFCRQLSKQHPNAKIEDNVKYL